MRNIPSQWQANIILSITIAAISALFAYLQYIKPDPKSNTIVVKGDTMIVNDGIELNGRKMNISGIMPQIQQNPAINTVTKSPPAINNTIHQGESTTVNTVVPDEYVNKTVSQADIAVAIIDAARSPNNMITSSIANLYRSKGYVVTGSLFKLKLFQSEFFEELENANSTLIGKLELHTHVKYVVIGIYSRILEAGTGEYALVVCRANLDVHVISCETQSQVDGFELAVSNGHGDVQHAEKGAIEKLMADYSANHLNL
ncbi:hypothetical protein SAMN05518672_103537 [Chitinophaga sp. CF118]|uniref:hypothetical protein n=1 Tax=Chitinophaga sp. CF118 TaxID=1884367 RepID=UPI0008E90E88|nr:hypothetical protein [Chitinophaga sp. CF118]SFD85620.1 hypothetical protein SAMN05518672_103537 [Chitinophaga sp. CF118]